MITGCCPNASAYAVRLRAEAACPSSERGDPWLTTRVCTSASSPVEPARRGAPSMWSRRIPSIPPLRETGCSGAPRICWRVKGRAPLGLSTRPASPARAAAAPGTVRSPGVRRCGPGRGPGPAAVPGGRPADAHSAGRSGRTHRRRAPARPHRAAVPRAPGALRPLRRPPGRPLLQRARHRGGPRRRPRSRRRAAAVNAVDRCRSAVELQEAGPVVGRRLGTAGSEAWQGSDAAVGEAGD